jgi:hypothetical protein
MRNPKTPTILDSRFAVGHGLAIAGNDNFSPIKSLNNIAYNPVLIGPGRFYTNFTLPPVNRRYMISVYKGRWSQQA